MLNWIAYTTILRLADVVTIWPPIILGTSVLEQGISFHGPFVFGFVVFGKAAGFGIASALKVEDAVVVPNVLVTPIRKRVGSADKVVLSVPESPKKN